jgi:hypothetical protein
MVVLLSVEIGWFRMQSLPPIHRGYKIQDTGYRIQDTGYRIQDTGYRIQDTGYRIQDARYRRQDTGYRAPKRHRSKLCPSVGHGAGCASRGCKIQKARYRACPCFTGMQDTGYKIQDTGCKIQSLPVLHGDARYRACPCFTGMQDTGCKIQLG